MSLIQTLSAYHNQVNKNTKPSIENIIRLIVYRVKKVLLMKNNYMINYLKKGLKSFAFFLLTLIVLSTTDVRAQVVTQIESIESNFFPMPGWKIRKGLLAEFTRVVPTTATNPTATALTTGYAATATAFQTTTSAVTLGGTNAIMLNSSVAANADEAFLISKPFDFSNNGGVAPTFSFWVYRNNQFPTFTDRLEVFWSGVSPGFGATLTPINHQGGTNVINRVTALAPTVSPAGGAGWFEYRFTLPTTAPYNTNRNYFVIRGIAQGGNNIYMDRFAVNTYPTAMIATDVKFDLVQQNLATTSPGASNQWILGVRCVVGGNSGCGALTTAGTNNPVKLDELLFNTNGSTNASADILNAKVYYTGGYDQFNPTINYVSPFPATTGITGASYPKFTYGATLTGGAIATNLDFQNTTGNCFYLEYDTTYFWLVYDLKPAAAGGNFLDGDFRGASVGGGPGSCPSSGTDATNIITATTQSYSLAGGSQVDIPYCIPTYTTGTAWANYTNNDYIAGVSLIGYGGTNLGNGVNLTTSSVPNSPSTQTAFPPLPSVPCQPFCPFTSHPPDYEFRNPVEAGNSVTLQQGVTYSITVKVGTWSSGNAISAWIDFNRDGIFDNGTMTWSGTPAQIAAGTGTYTGERLGFASLLANGTATWTFTVPAPGLIPAPFQGATRLRVREIFAASTTSMNPCNSATFGECEDFVVTILPNCPPGIKLWLGNTDDWNNPANWCPSLPTITDSTVIDKSIVGPGSRPYFYPVIKSGISANCKSLTISSQDTLFIDAPSPSTASLNIAGNLNNSGYINVVGTKTPTNNGVFPNTTGALLNFNMTPLCAKTYKEAQTQIIYLASDLVLLGMQNGDRITKIQLTVKNPDASPRTYNNFKIGYICSAAVPNQFTSTVPFTTGGVLNAYTNATQSIVTGLNEFTLGTPIVWDGTSNLLIQYTFSNIGGNGRANNDYIDITQSTGRNSILLLGRLAGSLATTPPVGAFTGQVTADITANGNPAANLANTFSAFNTLRPNATFVWERPYGKPKLVVKGSFTNNGRFSAGRSLFVMDGALTQRIAGARAIPFYTFCMAKSAENRPIILNNDTVSIQDTFFLQTGQMIMNKKPLYMTWSNPAAFSRLVQGTGQPTAPAAVAGTGLLISENDSAVVNWTIGSYVGSLQLASSTGFTTVTGPFFRTIPFGNRVDTTNATPAITYIPLTFTHKLGDLGVFKAATKNWLNNSTPYPPTVTHIDVFNSTAPNAANVVDRNWMIGKTGPQNPAANFPVADITFRFSSNNTAPQVTERPTIFSSGIPPRPGFAQPWRSLGLAWLRISNATAFTATVTSAVGNGTAITYTTSAITNFVPGQKVNITGMSPAGFNLVGAVVTAVTTVAPFTFTVANTLVSTSILPGTATMTPLSGGPTYNQLQTASPYTQAYGQLAASNFDSVRVQNWDWPTVPAFTQPYITPSGPVGDFTPWTIATAANPLPIELVDFKARPDGKRVRLDWTTASEVDNDYFTVERTTDLNEYSFIDKVFSYMHNSNILLNYTTYDEKPVYGLQYYRLKQTDFNGDFTYSDPKAVWFGSKAPFDITNIYSDVATSNDINVDFMYNSDLPVNVEITDVSGRVIYSESGVAATNGSNRIKLNASLPHGLYFIILRNESDAVSRKFVY